MSSDDGSELTPASKMRSFEDRYEEAMWECQRSAGNPPCHYAWGAYTWWDDPVHPVGGFNWFLTFDDLCVFLEKQVPVLCVAQDGHDLDGVVEDCRKTVDTMRTVGMPLDQFAYQLTQALAGGVRIDWIGGVADLLEGSGKFPARLRELYKSDRGAEPPKVTENAEDFIAFLRQLPECDWFGVGGSGSV